MYSLWETAVGVVVGADVVGDVYEVCLPGPYALCHVHGIADEVVAVVFFLKAQGVDDKGVGAFEYGPRCIGEAFHVGDVCEVPYAVSHDGEFAVHDGEGYDA